MQRPFELSRQELHGRLEEMVDVTMADLSSEFLLLPRGDAFLDYRGFQAAYEVLKRHTDNFVDFSEGRVMEAVLENSRAFCVLRATLGMTPPEWAELARVELGTDIGQGSARTLDRKCREKVEFVRELAERHQVRLARAVASGREVIEATKSLVRIEALVQVPFASSSMVHHRTSMA